MIRALAIAALLATAAPARPTAALPQLPPRLQVVATAPEPPVRMSFVRGYTRKDGRYVGPHWRAIFGSAAVGTVASGVAALPVGGNAAVEAYFKAIYNT